MIDPHSTRTASLIKKLAAAGKYTDELGAFELGILDVSRFENQKTKTTLTGVKKAQFVSGSPNVEEREGSFIKDRFNTTASFKSPVFSKVHSWRINKPTEARPFIGYFGYNGTQTCDFPKLECGSTLMVEVEARGSVVEKVFHVPSIFETFSVNLPCCTDCPSGCDVEEVQCKLPFEQIVAQMNDTKLAKVARFGIFSVLSDCDTAPAVTTYPTTTWCLDLCDAGDNLALSLVQAQYPGIGIQRIARAGNTSTYSVCLANPATMGNFIVPNLSIPSDCGVCPAGYTATTSGKYWTVIIDNTNSDLNPAAWLTQVQTKFTTATSATKVGFENGVSRYSVVFPTNFVPPGVIPTETELYGPFGDVDVMCNPTGVIAPVVWTSCGTGFKTKRTLCMTLPLKDCPTLASNLADVQAFYGTLGVYNPYLIDAITVTSTLDCFEKLELTQWNDSCLTSDCDTEQLPHYTNIVGYDGQTWDECPCVVVTEPTGCKCGIKVVSKLAKCVPGSCNSNPYSFEEYDTAEFSIHLRNNKLSCGAVEDLFYIAQKGLPLTLDGQRVLHDIILSRKYRNEMFAHQDLGIQGNLMDAFGYVYGIEKCKQYFAVEVTTESATNSNLTASFGDIMHTNVFYFEDPKTQNDFVNLVRTLTDIEPEILL